jgi:hypothetical protein
MLSCTAPLWAFILILTVVGEVLAYQQKESAQGQSAASVTISSTRNPVDKSYRAMVDGVKLFEARQHLHPGATLRFKLLPRQYDTKMDGIMMKIVGDSFSIPVALAADQTFTIPINQKALEEDASVNTNRVAGSMTWRVEIRTPNLPKNTRRLGDLRLECEVGLEANLTSSEDKVMNALRKITNWCTPATGRSGYLFFADFPIFNVTLNHNGRRESLAINYLYAGLSMSNALIKINCSDKDCAVLLDRTYFLPLGDKSWPDDTLVEFEYMESDQ